MSRGILMFGLNNETIDYLKLCIINAKLIKKNMGDIPISVITSEYSLSWTWAVENRAEIDKLVNLIVFEGRGGLNDLDEAANKRQFRDTQYYQKQDVFLNKRRFDAYNLSPYDETLLIDCDYLILSDSLNSAWGNVEDFLISKGAIHLNHGKFNSTEWRLNPYGLRMFWATVIYFQKTERAKLVFDLVEHIKNNWRYYSLAYDFPPGLYRNDFSFSIAIHMLSGFQDNDDFKSIPDAPLLTSLDKDQFIKMDNAQELITYVKNLSDDWSFSLQRISKVNVHIMNKLALLNNADKVLEAIK
jgi:hypothetical protein